MVKLTGKERIIFFHNQGIRYALSGHIGFGNYRTEGEAWEHFINFKPFRPLEIGEEKGDREIFANGFNKAKGRMIVLQKIKLVAEAECKSIMAKHETRSKGIEHLVDMKAWQDDNPHVTEGERKAIKQKAREEYAQVLAERGE